MKYIADTLYIEFQEMLDCGVSKGTLDSTKQRNTSGWVFTDDPADNRKSLIRYSTLSDRYKQQVISKYGDPYKYMAATIIRQHLIIPESDKHFIQSYTLPDGSNLPHPAQHRYTAACSILNLLCNYRIRDIRSLGFSSVDDFYQAVLRIIESDDIALPTNYSRLKAKAREYKKSGAECVISRKWCNTNSLKVNDQVCESVLLEMISHSSKFDDVFVARKYNTWASQGGYKSITATTVGNWRRKNAVEITNGRDGVMAFHNEFTPVIKRGRPTAPLLLINSDDNNLDLFFRDGKNPYSRLTLVVVMDAFNDYILGYAVGKSQTIDLVRSAYLNAIHHIREITGEQLLWHQIQTDAWGLKALRNWYESQAIFTPARTGNARSKPIERAFGKGWHAKLKTYLNWGGHNITALQKRNPDAIQAHKKDFPTVEEGILQVAHFINRLRTDADDNTGISKQQKWLESYQAMLPEQKKQLTHERRLELFGMQHSYSNTLSNAGFNITINKSRLTYDVPVAAYKEHVGKTMQLIYDPYDMSSVLATMDDCRIKVLCPINEPMKMAIADMQPGDRLKLNVRLKEQREIGQYALDAQAQRRDVLQRKGIDAASLLQANVLVKEDRQLAENSYYESEYFREELESRNQEEEPNQKDYHTGDRWSLQLKLKQEAGQ